MVDGYGIEISVHHGQLRIIDGNGRNRRHQHLPKAGHGITRLVITGTAGSITLDAIRWMHRTGITLIQLDTNGRPLLTHATPSIDNARLRRAQALAPTSPHGLAITHDLLTTKFHGQAHVARHHLHTPTTAERITALADAIAATDTIASAVELEATAANDYFTTWTNNVTITWARNDQDRVPDTWHTFTGRRSPLNTSGARRAADPINALLNYLYGLAETECTLACHTLGLDPGLGIIHADVANRDSLALDLIETIRPDVDTYLLNLLTNHTFTRTDFIETDDGHVRLAHTLAQHLAHTLTTWRTAIGPYAEHTAHQLADASPYTIHKPTPITSATRRSTAHHHATPRRKHPDPLPTPPPPRSEPVPPRTCPDCGTTLPNRRSTYCPDCWPQHRTQAGLKGSQAAAQLAANPENRRRRGAAIAQAKANSRATTAAQVGITPQQWRTRIQPRVAKLTLRQIMTATGLSQSYASKIKRGINTPHPRHWRALLNVTQPTPPAP